MAAFGKVGSIDLLSVTENDNDKSHQLSVSMIEKLLIDNIGSIEGYFNDGLEKSSRLRLRTYISLLVLIGTDNEDNDYKSLEELWSKNIMQLKV